MKSLACALVVPVILTAACVDAHETEPSEASASLLSVHWPEEQPGPDSRFCVVRATGEEIALDPDPIITLEHVSRAYVEEDQEPIVNVELTETGRRVLASATADRIGDQIAIVFDDQIEAMPLIRASLDTPEIPLWPMGSRIQAEGLAERINAAIAVQDKS
jgi:preprotein translocase subunit SecD